MKEKSIRRQGGRWLRYVLTEVIFLVVAALFVLILWGHEKRASRKRDEELLRNIVEMFPAPMDDCQAARQYLQGIRLLWSDEAYKDRFTTSISIGDRQIADSLREINLLFYVENGKNRVWDLSEHFSKKQLEEVSRIADRLTGDKGFGRPMAANGFRHRLQSEAEQPPLRLMRKTEAKKRRCICQRICMTRRRRM